MEKMFGLKCSHKSWSTYGNNVVMGSGSVVTKDIQITCVMKSCKVVRRLHKDRKYYKDLEFDVED